MNATGVQDLLRGSPYVGYAYAYPHKMAYRALDPRVELREAWSAERKDALFLYLHVPFCEARCGFCNLFSLARPEPGFVEAYIHALERQATAVWEALGQAAFARMAIGGGTPTLLGPAGLGHLFDVAERVFGAAPAALPTSVEVSPRTARLDALQGLRERGAQRISLGVQSFRAGEVRRAGRPQEADAVERALAGIRALGFPVLNVDLIYGLPGQTVATWITSLRRALSWRPEELYLYPLYVRPLTGLAGASTSAPDVRLECYRAGRELLLAAGYAQLSMRMFRAPGAPGPAGPVYCCQEDGMVGLGCGARSYTRALHYADRYAITRAGIRAILEEFVSRPAEAFAVAHNGFRLDAEEQRRRWVIKSLLRAEGFALASYRARFGSDLLSDLPEVDALTDAGLVAEGAGQLCLTEAGLERSDAIGPFLFSAAVRRRVREFALR